jgi:hypothetical protein
LALECGFAAWGRGAAGQTLSHLSRNRDEVGVGGDELSRASGSFGGWRLMPKVSVFYGIVIRMYWNERDHPVAHFHAEYDGRSASVAIDGTVLAGFLPPRAVKLVRR